MDASAGQRKAVTNAEYKRCCQAVVTAISRLVKQGASPLTLLDAFERGNAAIESLVNHSIADYAFAMHGLFSLNDAMHKSAKYTVVAELLPKLVFLQRHVDRLERSEDIYADMLMLADMVWKLRQQRPSEKWPQRIA